MKTDNINAAKIAASSAALAESVTEKKGSNKFIKKLISISENDLELINNFVKSGNFSSATVNSYILFAIKEQMKKDNLI